MEKIIWDKIKVGGAIILGGGMIFLFKEYLAGIILMVIVVLIVGINKNLRTFFFSPIISSIKWLWDKISGKEQSQNMENSPGATQQKSGRDSYIAGRDINVVRK